MRLVKNPFRRPAYPFGDPSARKEAADCTNVFCENAAWVEQRCFFVPVHPTYEEGHVEMMGRAIRKVLSGCAVLYSASGGGG